MVFSRAPRSGAVLSGWALGALALLAMPALTIAEESKPKPTEAERLLDQIVEAYRSAPGLEDRVEFKLDFGPMSPPPQKFTVTLGAKTDAKIDAMPMSGLGLCSSGGDLYLIKLAGDPFGGAPTGPSDEKVAVKMALGKDPIKTIEKEIGASLPMAPQLVMRWGCSRDEALRALLWGLIENPKIERVERVATESSAIDRLHVTGAVPFSDDPAKATVDVDAKSHFLVGASAKAKSKDGDVGFTYSYTPKLLATPPKIEFDATGYDIKKSMSELFAMDMAAMAPSVKIGEPAPAFSLVDHTGTTHALEGLAGKYVLLDWWGIW